MDTITQSRPASKKRPLGIIAVIALVVLLVVIDMRRRAAESQLAQLSVKLDQLNGGNQEQNREAADRIVKQVRELYALPADSEPTVATIVDVEALRSRNTFYNKAENGDYLVVTTDRAVLAGERGGKFIIIDVVPVQIQAADQPGAAATR